MRQPHDADGWDQIQKCGLSIVPLEAVKGVVECHRRSCDDHKGQHGGGVSVRLCGVVSTRFRAERRWCMWRGLLRVQTTNLEAQPAEDKQLG